MAECDGHGDLVAVTLRDAVTDILELSHKSTLIRIEAQKFVDFEAYDGRVQVLVPGRYCSTRHRMSFIEIRWVLDASDDARATGAWAKTWCILIHAEASLVSLRRLTVTWRASCDCYAVLPPAVSSIGVPLIFTVKIHQIEARVGNSFRESRRNS